MQSRGLLRWYMLLLSILSANSIIYARVSQITSSSAHVAQQVASSSECTFMVFIAGRNNLAGFAPRNIKQMAATGSNEHVNILVHFDGRLPGGVRTTRRYLILHNQIIHLNAQDPLTQAMDSGDPETVISFVDWSVKHFPAKQYVLLFWNHGFGIIDPQNGRLINTNELFTLNPVTNKLQLDRSIDLLDLIESPVAPRGVCWDDSTGNYLTNQKLEYALATITQRLGKKLDMVVFDACLMAMMEVASIVKQYSDYMVASQEVVLGPGYNYDELLKPFAKSSMSMEEFARHIVQSFFKTYDRVTEDYTQSAINMRLLDAVEKNIHEVAAILLDGLSKQTQFSVKQMIRSAAENSVHFDVDGYIDLHHFYRNLLAYIEHMHLQDAQAEFRFKMALQGMVQEGITLLEKAIISSVAGPNLAQARGLSIYLPKQRIHPSYKRTEFCQKNNWGNLLTQMLAHG